MKKSYSPYLRCLLFFYFTGKLFAHERILFLGDSLAFGKLGDKIHTVANATKGVSLAMYLGCGFQASDFLKNNPYSDCGYKYKNPDSTSWKNMGIGSVPGIHQLTRDFNPTMVIIELGGNMYWQLKHPEAPLTNKNLMNEMLAMKEAALGSGEKPRKCLWITPQYTVEDVSREKQRAFEEIAEEVLKPECEVFLSYEITRNYCSKNHIYAAGHPSSELAEYLASQILQRILPDPRDNAPHN